jgi:hypothetical protein
MEIFTEQLVAYGKQGYQIVFDFEGIRVWYLPSIGNEKLYHGQVMEEALSAIEQHAEDGSEV